MDMALLYIWKIVSSWPVLVGGIGALLFGLMTLNPMVGLIGFCATALNVLLRMLEQS